MKSGNCPLSPHGESQIVSYGRRRGEEEKEEEGKKSPGGRAASAAAAAAFSTDPLCVDVVKWLVRKCERDNDRLCMTPLGAPHFSCEAPLLSHIHPPL